MAQPNRRPGVVTLIGVILFVQSALAGVAGLVTIVLHSDSRVQSDTGQTSASLIWTGITELLVAILLFVVAAGIMQGARGARLLVVVVEGLRMATAIMLMMIHHDGAFVFSGTVTLLVGVFVYWALYAHPESDEFFRRSDAWAGP